MHNEMSPVAESLTLDAETEAAQHSMRAKRWPRTRDVFEAAAARAAGDAGLYSSRRAAS